MVLSETDIGGVNSSSSDEENTCSSLSHSGNVSRQKRKTDSANISPDKERGKKRTKKKNLQNLPPPPTPPMTRRQKNLLLLNNNDANASSLTQEATESLTNVASTFQQQQEQQQQEPMYTSDFITENRFNILPVEETSRYTSKPPPVYVYKIENFNVLKNALIQTLGADSFTCKSRVNNIQINTNSIEVYRKLIHFLRDNNKEYHTYQVKEDKPYRVVLRHLHHTTPVTDIKEEISALGYKVRNVINVLHPKEKFPLPLFFVDLEPDSKNSDIFKVTRLLYSVVKIEEPYKTRELKQCKRCQQYGHTRGYCNVNPRCCKCAGPHLTTACTQEENDYTRTCALCSGSHPASYKGCNTHKTLQRLRRINEHQRGQGAAHRQIELQHRQNLPPQVTEETYPPLPEPAHRHVPPMQHQQPRPPLQQQQQQQPPPSLRQQPIEMHNASYSQAARPFISQPRLPAFIPPPQPRFPTYMPTPQSSSADITSLLNTFFQKFESLISPLLTLLNTVVSQLLPRLSK